ESLHDVASSQGKREVTTVLLPVVRRLQDPAEPDHYPLKITSIPLRRLHALLDSYKQTLTHISNPLRRHRLPLQHIDPSHTPQLACRLYDAPERGVRRVLSVRRGDLAER